MFASFFFKLGSKVGSAERQPTKVQENGGFLKGYKFQTLSRERKYVFSQNTKEISDKNIIKHIFKDPFRDGI